MSTHALKGAQQPPTKASACAVVCTHVLWHTHTHIHTHAHTHKHTHTGHGRRGRARQLSRGPPVHVPQQGALQLYIILYHECVPTLFCTCVTARCAAAVYEAAPWVCTPSIFLCHHVLTPKCLVSKVVPCHSFLAHSRGSLGKPLQLIIDHGACPRSWELLNDHLPVVGAFVESGMVH